MTPEALGERYQASLSRARRRRLGAFYTPPALAAELAAATLRPLLERASPERIRVCDPAVGCGALLLAAARVLIGAGGDPHAVSENMTGIDIDPDAVELARTALTLLTGHPPPDIRVGDALLEAPRDSFDAVLANPPFHGQLKSATVRDRSSARALSERFGGAAGGYADTAGLFLMACVELVPPGGRVGIVLPEPVAATRDGGPARAWVGARTTLDRMWCAPAGTFDAGVRTLAAVCERGCGGDGAWRRGEWSVLANGPGGPPAFTLPPGGVIGDVATTTADFRDQYYGLARIAVDDARPDAGPRLVTCGLIDPARLRWGTRTARLARRSLAHPRAAVDRLAPDDRLRTWVDRSLVPKVLLATQTRVTEAVADESGELLPVVPVISVVPRDGDLWSLLAVLLSPPIAAYARRRYAGAALSADAIKLSARQVAALPLPPERGAWAQGARCAEEASRAGDPGGWRSALDRLGHTMCDAYRVPAATVMPWWSARVERLAATW